MELNVPQQIFTVFYAIAWGTTANALPRWKAFAWGRVFVDPPSRRRIVPSVILLNLLPIGVYVLVLWLLSGPVWALSESGSWTTFRLIVCVLAALSVFGCYRIWTSVIQHWGPCFYGPKEAWKSQGWEKGYPGLNTDDDLNPQWAGPNLLFGILYLALALLPLLTRAIAYCVN